MLFRPVSFGPFLHAAIQWKVNGDPGAFPKYEDELDEHRDGGERPVARNMTRDELLYAAVYRTQVRLLPPLFLLH